MPKIIIPDHRAVSWNKLYRQTHWTRRKALVDGVHELVWAYLPLSRLFWPTRVDISITAYFKSKVVRDSDNIAAKLYIDALKGKGIKDDDTRFVRKVTTEARVGEEEDKVIIEVLPVKK